MPLMLFNPLTDMSCIRAWLEKLLVFVMALLIIMLFTMETNEEMIALGLRVALGGMTLEQVADGISKRMP